MSKLLFASIVIGLLAVGCSKSKPAAPVVVQKHQEMPKIDSAADAPPPAPDLNGTVAPATADTAPANPSASDLRPQATGPIVPGSPEDPNVMPKGFIPKPIPREYVVNGKIDLTALTETLRDYCMWKKTVPEDLNELVTSKYLPSLPEPPPGKKFEIKKSDLEVTLANK